MKACSRNNLALSLQDPLLTLRGVWAAPRTTAGESHDHPCAADANLPLAKAGVRKPGRAGQSELERRRRAPPLRAGFRRRRPRRHGPSRPQTPRLTLIRRARPHGRRCRGAARFWPFPPLPPACAPSCPGRAARRWEPALADRPPAPLR